MYFDLRRFFVCFYKLTDPDIDDNFFFSCIKYSWHNHSWRSQASIFDGFKCFVHVFLSESYIVDNAITASATHINICTFFFLLSSLSVCVSLLMCLSLSLSLSLSACILDHLREVCFVQVCFNAKHVFLSFKLQLMHLDKHNHIEDDDS